MRKAIVLISFTLLLFFNTFSFSFNLPDNTAKKNVFPAYSFYLKGLLSDRYGDSDRALKEYIKAEKYDQESTSLRLRIAVQYIKLNDFLDDFLFGNTSYTQIF